MDETDISRHRQAWDLIPWVVNGSAGVAERRVVDAHVAVCADCRAEFAFQQQLHDGMADGAAPHDPGPALQRFWARVEAGEGDGATERVPVPPPRGERWVRWLAAAVVLQAIGLAVLGGVLWERPRAAAYETLSQAPPPAARAAASIRLVPAPSLTIGELRALLERAGVQLADSSADGAILGLVPRPGGAGSRADALARLRAEPGVLLAEPIGTAVGR